MSQKHGSLLKVFFLLTVSLLLVTLPAAAANLVANGEFDDGVKGWTFQAQSGAIAALQVVTDADMSGPNAAYVNIRRGGSLHWHVECFTHFNMEKGKTYQASFLARAEKDRTVTVMIQRDFSPWSPYGVEEKINITTETKTYTLTWVAEADDPNTRINIAMGGNNASIWLDNVQIIEVEAGAAPVIEEAEEEVVVEEVVEEEVEEEVAEEPAKKKLDIKLIIIGAVVALALVLLR